MKHTHRKYVKTGFLLTGFAVALGAFGSHWLKKLLDEQSLNTFEIGIRYQMIHALALIILGLNHRKFNETKLNIALWMMVLGTILFSGSLYLLATRNLWGNESFSFVGAITPLGGLLFILSWLILFFSGFSNPEKYNTEKEDSEEVKEKKRHRSRKSTDNPAE